MALKIFLIAITLFLAEIIFITTKEFKSENFTKKDFDATDIAFEQIDGYLISKDGIQAFIKASEVLKYANKSEIFNIKTIFQKENLEYKISAKTALLQNDILHLRGDVVYENNRSLKILSQYILYNTKNEIAISKTPFILTSPRGKIIGDQFEYDQKNGKIKANNLNYLSKKEL